MVEETKVVKNTQNRTESRNEAVSGVLPFFSPRSSYFHHPISRGGNLFAALCFSKETSSPKLPVVAAFYDPSRIWFISVFIILNVVFLSFRVYFTTQKTR